MPQGVHHRVVEACALDAPSSTHLARFGGDLDAAQDVAGSDGVPRSVRISAVVLPLVTDGEALGGAVALEHGHRGRADRYLA